MLGMGRTVHLWQDAGKRHEVEVPLGIAGGAQSNGTHGKVAARGVAWVLVFEYLHAAQAKGHAHGMVIRWGNASYNGGGTNGGRDAIHAGKLVETEHRVSEGIITFGRRRKGVHARRSGGTP